MAVMAGPWSLDKLAAAAGETERRLRWFADVGLLHRQADGDFEPDSLHRLRLIQFARRRGISDEQLMAANAKQGDLLTIFDEPRSSLMPRRICSMPPGSSVSTMP
jgi:adenylate cyclase